MSPVNAPVPSAEELLERARVVALPMRVRFRGVQVREAMLVEGPAGWAEFSPFPEYGDAEAARWLRSCVELGWSGPPEPLRDDVEVNATVPAVDAARVPELLGRYPGCATVKVKVAEPGQRLADDVARVAAVREALPGARVRCDANMGWTPDEAVAAARALGELDYLEQPCRTVAELAEVRARVRAEGLPVRVAADESIRKAEDPWEVVRMDAADVAVVKAAPLGGPRAVVELGRRLADHGVALTVSSALETAVGMYAGLSAAAALPDPQPCGLATGSLFAEDVCAPRELRGGRLAAVPAVPDPDRLEALAAPGDRRDWWLDRARRCLRLL
ncbi:o-succinylbenzoate synthase [Corynebacterium sp. 335C]